MRGDGYVYRPDSHTPEHLELNGEPDLAVLKNAIGGGWLEAIPHWNRYEGKPAVAFCDEEGKMKGLPFNRTATVLWHKQLKGTVPSLRDMLVGAVLVVTGDEQFMEAL